MDSGKDESGFVLRSVEPGVQIEIAFATLVHPRSDGIESRSLRAELVCTRLARTSAVFALSDHAQSQQTR